MDPAPAPAPVLYAEDSEDDAYLLQRAFRQAGVAHPLLVVPNGKAVVQYLSGSGPYSERSLHPFPRLVLLDIKLPHRTGLDVLCWIRQQPEMRELPVIMLTSSAHDRDVDSAYALGANGYLVKPSNAAGLAQLGEDLGRICATPEAAGAWVLRGDRFARPDWTGAAAGRNARIPAATSDVTTAAAGRPRSPL